MGRKARPAAERFWEAVNKEGPLPEQRPELGQCWIWLRKPNHDGYGIFSEGMAHRWSYMQARGEIPNGLEIDHLCSVRLCVRPSHLEAVTHIENIRRGNNHNRAKTSCRNGHPYTAENTYTPAGSSARICRVCGRVNSERRRRKAGIVPRTPTTHCPAGHRYNEVNTWVDPKNGSKHCRVCLRERARKRREATAA